MMILLLHAASANRPTAIVATAAPRNPSASPTAIPIAMPTCGGSHASMTMTHAPMIHPVAMRGNVPAMVRRRATTTATRGMSTAAQRITNAKSNA